MPKKVKHHRKLLEPGWAGDLGLDEAVHIACALREDRGLRRQWGFRKNNEIPLTDIAARALPESPEFASSKIRSFIAGSAIEKRGLYRKHALEVIAYSQALEEMPQSEVEEMWRRWYGKPAPEFRGR